MLSLTDARKGLLELVEESGFKLSADGVQYDPENSDAKALVFRDFNPDEVIAGKTMAEWFRFAVCYWHTFRGTGQDPFGAGTLVRPWDDGSGSLDMYVDQAAWAMAFVQLIRAKFYCFHDRDIAPEGKTLTETNSNLDAVVDRLEELQAEAVIELLWGTANLFSHPRYLQGAATSPSADVVLHAMAQVKKAIEVTHRLGGANYVFWGGREGYDTLWNTDMGRELAHLGIFMKGADEFATSIGFDGTFLFEPKPCEPTKHQYDHDVAACMNFIRQFDLLDRVKLNVETNHATLAGHTMMHELESARAQDALGSIDANTGDLALGWDTDQFTTDDTLTTEIMTVIMRMDGFATGGTNFDAKVRRASTDVVDIFHAHVGSMDAFARGLRKAAALREKGDVGTFVRDRYASFDSGVGKQFALGNVSFADAEQHIMTNGLPEIPASGRQEWLENLVARG